MLDSVTGDVGLAVGSLCSGLVLGVWISDLGLVPAVPGLGLGLGIRV